MPEFVHLHCHTQYSLLDGAANIGKMMKKAVADGQKGVALTDHGNMFGAFKFVAEAKRNDIKPIIGCEFYLVEDRHKKSFAKSAGEKDIRYHQLLLAKNSTGYQNLMKLCSLGFIEGLYSKYPRIDKELLEKYHEGIIATSCCIGAEIPQAILQGKIDKAEKLLKWWLDLFGEDYYIELQRHRNLDNIDGTGVSQEDINQQLIQFAQKHNVKLIATNDSHYVEEEDHLPHDILLCVNTASLLSEKKRFKFPSSDFYFKTQAEMNQLFSDQPSSIDNTMEIFSKIEPLTLARDVLLPAFPLPQDFSNQSDYLRHLTYQGAKTRYGTITPQIKERLDFELSIIDKTGYPGYFLIVQDFTSSARKMGVSVGPGRGSAAGSAVAYCTGITNVDPIKYDLLFERFLNPDRVSMPDIDIDFDDIGRQKVIDFVIDKYGKNQVAQIVTYGTMKAKSAIRDVGRVMDIPLVEVDKVAKSFPDNLDANLEGIIGGDEISAKLKDKFNTEDMERASTIRELAKQDDQIGEMLRTALKLEGSVRNTGIHACAVVITPDEVSNYVPVKLDKESQMYVSQFDNSVAEDAGLLKMDFLGLRTLTIIKDAVKMVEENHNITLDIEAIPLDDAKTYELFQRGETMGVFQYESPGMQKYMRDLAPTTFDDLIAMNALYRPGPLEYIPNFVNRKHGREPVTYDLPAMEGYLKSTYGITVYQEQVMLLSQKLANFTRGQADSLRKAMGKKKKKLIDQLYPLFIEGGTKNGHPKDILDKVWKDWEAFASYAFNKSHSTCYAFIAFQTAYLKAHYPAEFMAAVLTHNKKELKTLTKYLRECKRMGIDVLSADVNESAAEFSVNKSGQIRFGLTALKGVGEGPVESILAARGAEGFTDIFDFIRKINLRSVNKKSIESLAKGGGFDNFSSMHRAQYFCPSEKYSSFIEHLIRYGNAYEAQLAEAQNSLFGASSEIMIPEPKIPTCEEWSLIEKLSQEKEVAGIYITGHPLDDYEMEVNNFTTCPLDKIEDYKGRNLRLAGIVTQVNERFNKKGVPWGIFKIQDYTSALEFVLFKDDYQDFKDRLRIGNVVFISGKYAFSEYRSQYQLRIEDVNLLESVAEDLTQSITLEFELHQVTERLITEVVEICNTKQGKHDLKMILINPSSKEKIAMKSRTIKVNADTDFVNAIKNLGLSYRLN